MKVVNISHPDKDYTSNVYHISGDLLRLTDLNTLIDVGREKTTLDDLQQIPIGIGKKPVDQVILTHSHFDHTGLLHEIRERYHPVVYAHPETRISGTEVLQNGEEIQVGNRTAEIIFTPGHSEDSLCIYCEEEGALFSGDIPIRIYSPDEVFSSSFLRAFEDICTRNIQIIYPGHGDPLTGDLHKMLHESLENIRMSHIRDE